MNTDKITIEQLSGCYDMLLSPVWIADPRGNFLYVNISLLRLWNMTKDAIVGLNIKDLPLEIDKSILAMVLQDRLPVSALQHIRSPKYRREIVQLATVTPVFDSTGDIAYAVGQAHVINIKYANGIIDTSATLGPVIDASAGMKETGKVIRTIAKVDSPVLITGESGTGKEMTAREIHEQSKRAKKPLAMIDCAGVSDAELCLQLFGYEKGYEGHKERCPGLIEQAKGGILFFDNIDALSIDMQTILLKLIENKNFLPFGAKKSLPADFRIISATQANIQKLCKQKQFRSDLYYRLNTVPLKLAPLRDRRDDIIPLANYYMDYYCKQYGLEKKFSEAALQRLRVYSWPGNVNQLKTVVEGCLINSARDCAVIDQISESLLPNDSANSRVHIVVGNIEGEFDFSNFDLTEYMDTIESSYLKKTLGESKSSYEAADKLKLSQSAVARKKKKYNL